MIACLKNVSILSILFLFNYFRYFFFYYLILEIEPLNFVYDFIGIITKKKIK